MLSNSFLMGTFSGIVVTIIAFIVGTVWKNKVIPLLERRFYKGTKLKKYWLSEITFPAGEVNNLRMEINQKGHKISGKVHCVDGFSKGNHYDFHGTFFNLILTTIYKIDNPSEIERGAQVLMLVNDGKTLKGILAFYDNQTHSILSTDCEWTVEKEF